MKQFHAALVGCGLFGESHLSALRAVPGVCVNAVYDVDRARAAALAAKYQVPVTAASLDALRKRAQAVGLECHNLGTAGGNRLTLRYEGVEVVDIPLEELESAWRQGLPKLLS